MNEMDDAVAIKGAWWNMPVTRWRAFLASREEQVFLVLTLLIGALVGLAVVALIVVSERFGQRLYPLGSAPWRRLLMPCVGSLSVGYLLYRFFPDARRSGIPQTKAALFAREGKISLVTVVGKFFCTSVTLASGIPLGREGPAVQVGSGIASVLGRALGLRPERGEGLRRRLTRRWRRCCLRWRKLSGICTRRCLGPWCLLPPQAGEFCGCCLAMS